MTTQSLELNVAAEFTRTPGPRKRSEGEYSGEEFLSLLLRPRFIAALEAGVSLRVNLDCAAGYPTSFLEEAFGGLAREFGSEKVAANIELSCDDEPYLVEDIKKFIREAKTTR
ncbi:MAG: STAS-like domain-containing protein [Bryobacteraceae bacterium]|jgi:hypothetical protein